MQEQDKQKFEKAVTVFEANFRAVEREPEGRFFMTFPHLCTLRSRVIHEVHGYGQEVTERVDHEFDFALFCLTRKNGRAWYPQLWLPV